MIALPAALDYAARAWPVFPLHSFVDGCCTCGDDACGSPGKHPRTRRGLHDATTDADQVRRWFDAEHVNVGLVTGVAFDVLDIDGPTGLDSLGALVADYGVLPAGPVSQTGNGWHLLFAPTGLGNRAGFRPGLDWRGAGGYIVAPPSVHRSGHVYRWCDPDPEDDALTVGLDEPWPLPVPDGPRWLLDILRAPKPHAAIATRPVAQGGSTPYGRRALESELGRLALAVEGQRNHQLNASAFALGQLVASGALDAREVVEALLAVAARVGLGESEAEATIASGMRAGMSQPRSIPA